MDLIKISLQLISYCINKEKKGSLSLMLSKWVNYVPHHVLSCGGLLFGPTTHFSNPLSHHMSQLNINIFRCYLYLDYP